MLALLFISGATFAATANSNHGIYVKLHVGESFSANEKFEVSSNGYWADRYNDFSNKIGNVFLLGGGVGYRFNSILRADVTYDYRNTYQYSKEFFNSDRKRKFDIDNYTVMANLYLDAKGLFANSDFGIFNPYIGGGIGMARSTTKNYTVTSMSTASTPNRIGPYSTNSLAWQLMVGSSVDLTNLTKNLQLDFGYRYVNLGKIFVDTASITEPWLNPLARLSVDNAAAHELYVGVRYNFF